MKILLCNDDGINAKGIHTLMRELSTIAEIFIVAPDRERSGTGHSITVFDPIRVSKIHIPGIKAAWVAEGTPVDCVKLAVNKLIKEDIDLLVSGINHGANLGTDVLYSGTVSAAAEGVIMGVPSLAVSLDSFDRNVDFRFSARITKKVISTVMRKGLDKGTLININIPAILPEEVKGFRITRLGTRNYDNLFEERQDPRGNTYYWLGGGVVDEFQEKDSDVVAVEEGWISVTPIHLDLTDYRLIREFKETFAPYLEKPNGELNDIS